MTAATINLFTSSQGVECPAVSREIWDGLVSEHFDATATVRATLQTPVDQQAFAWLINCHLDVSPSSLDPGYLNVLNRIARSQHKGKCLEACFSTFALAAFSRQPACRSATGNAQASYSVALKAVIDCIANSESIYDNELLAAVIILAQVECLIGDGTNGYYNHVYGAIKILKSRSRVDFSDDLGAELFVLLRNELLRSSVVKPFEPRDQHSYHRLLPVIGNTNEPYVERPQTASTGMQQNPFVSHIHKIVDKYLPINTSSSPVLSLLSVPNIPAPNLNINDLIENDSISAKAPRQRLSIAANAFEVPDISRYSIEDFVPPRCDVHPISRNGKHTCNSGQYLDFDLCLSAARLYGYNVAAMFFEAVKPRDPSIDTLEHLVFRGHAQVVIDMIIGSGNDMCRQQDIEGARSNDYMWLHQWIPFFVAMGSPFASNE